MESRIKETERKWVSTPLTFSMKDDFSKIERKRDEFRKKHKTKFVDKKWINEITTIGVVK